MAGKFYHKISGDFHPIKDHVLVINMEQGDKITKGGLIVLDDNGKDRGIRPRWCQVWKVGPKQTEIKPGEWLLVEHGRWTYGFETSTTDDSTDAPLFIQRVDLKGIMLVSDECPL